VFTMYSKDYLTEQEIADKLGVSRATVISDLKRYRAEHPEEVDKTYLWRQRNLAGPAKAVRIDKKAAVSALRHAGLSVSQISRATGVPQSAAAKYLEEDGVEYRGDIQLRRNEKLKLIRSMLASGSSREQIGEVLGQSAEQTEKDVKAASVQREKNVLKAESARLAWNGAKTSHIMGTLGRTRAAVMKDQHATAAVLRNNPSALAEMVASGGQIGEDFYDKYEK